MSLASHNPLRRTLLAVLAAPILLASVTAAAPLATARVHAAAADRVAYKDTFYSSSSHTTVVGTAYGYCDGDYIVATGYETPYFTTKYYPPCP